MKPPAPQLESVIDGRAFEEPLEAMEARLVSGLSVGGPRG